MARARSTLSVENIQQRPEWRWLVTVLALLRLTPNVSV